MSLECWSLVEHTVQSDLHLQWHSVSVQCMRQCQPYIAIIVQNLVEWLEARWSLLPFGVSHVHLCLLLTVHWQNVAEMWILHHVTPILHTSITNIGDLWVALKFICCHYSTYTISNMWFGYKIQTYFILHLKIPIIRCASRPGPTSAILSSVGDIQILTSPTVYMLYTSLLFHLDCPPLFFVLWWFLTVWI